MIANQDHQEFIMMREENGLEQDLLVRAHGSVVSVAINRPAKRNAMTKRMWAALAARIEDLGSNDAVRAIILSGEGKSFSAGADISEFQSVRAGAQEALAYDDAVDACCRAIAQCPKVTVAVVQGACMGGGVALAMACDFRIASPDASFRIPAARLSIVYSVYNTRKLIALCGITEAKRALLTAESLSAEQAVRIGLADQVSESAMGDALRLAECVANNAPLAVAGAKLICASSEGGESIAPSPRIVEAIRAAADSADAREAREAFKDRREPAFIGR